MTLSRSRANASGRLPLWCQRGDALREALSDALEESRARLLSITAAVPEELMRQQPSPFVSPLGWELGHLANFEELWLVRALGGAALMPPQVDELYDAFRQPRAVRGELPVLEAKAARAYLAQTRKQTLAMLARTSFSTAQDPLRHAAFIHGFVLQHEHRHCESILAALQLLGDPSFRPQDVARREGRALPSAEVFVEGGPFVMGTNDDPWALDVERPAHVVNVPSFFIDTAQVTCAQFQAFIEEGGYQRRELWSEAGWSFIHDEAIVAPLYWQRGGDCWLRRRFATLEEVPADEPVQHVSCYEAEAYARWANKRLPTEAEWEKAAAWDAKEGKRRMPWGDDGPTERHANLALGRHGPMPTGAFPEGVSPCGAHGMLGDVWEWTASGFFGYPGFHPLPTPEQSQAFFGEGLGTTHRVLRGGSWATHPTAIRPTTRSWDVPVRRDIFAGFRCARSA